MAPRYMMKPIIVEALMFTYVNHERLIDFCGKALQIDWRGDEIIGGYIQTLDGSVFVAPGDYIIKGVDNEFYPCKPSVFDKTYKSLNDA